jgi:hypothetical protein
MNPAFLLLAALLLSASPSWAGNWHTLQSNSQMTLEANDPELEVSDGDEKGQDKIRNKEKKLKVWSKSTYSRPEQARPGDFFYSSAKSLYAINCSKRTHRLQQKVYYAADDKEIKSVRYGENGKNESVVPDTEEERVLVFACAFKVTREEGKTLKRTQSKSSVSADKPSADNKAEQPVKASQKPVDPKGETDKAPANNKSTAANSPKKTEPTNPKR